MRFSAVFSVLALSVAAASANNVDTSASTVDVSSSSSSLQKRTLWLNPFCWFGKCVDTTSDPWNCGSIGHICPSSWPFGLGGGQCVDSVCMPQSCQSGCLLHRPSASCIPVSDDPNNCGSVGNKCSMPNALSNGCTGGTCVANSCASGYDLIGGKCVKHINLMTDSDNCGILGLKCPSSFPFGIGTQCKNGICQPVSCNSGCLWHQPSGSCKDVRSDPQNCGSIGNVCAFPNGQGSCVSGSCQLSNCSPGFTKVGDKCLWLDLQGDCDNCGSPGNKCQYDNGVAQCQSGKCSLKNCNPGYQQVGQTCQKIDTTRDPQNCGSVGFKCPASYLNGGSAICQNGKCTTNCNSGWLFDWGLNFCRRVDNDCNNCGAIGNKCTIQNGTPSCNNGVCGLESCNPGYKAVNGQCQPVDTQDDNKNCGWFGNICPAKYDNGGIGICLAGKCTTICNAGFDFDWLGNFCRDVRSDPQNCGACGSKCQIANAIATTCQWGKCKATACKTGYELQSDGTCKAIDTNNNPNHCGWFGNCCTFTPQGAAGICKNGQCVTTYCPPPYILNGNICTLSPSGKARLAKKDNVAPEKRTLCPTGEEACPIAGSSSFSTSFTQQFASLDNVVSPGGYECVDTRTALDSCGGCASTGAGLDCSAIPNSAGVGCDNGTCVVFSCSAGYKPSIDGSSCVRAGSSHRNGTTAARRHLQNKLNQRASHHHHS